MLKTVFILTASLAAVLATATPAFARQEAPAVRLVHYSDINLATAAGRDRLRRRVDAAVRAVCSATYPTELRATVDVTACREATRAAIVLPSALSETVSPAVAAGVR